ncbi:MAG: hypothetical protein AMXMBFR64_61480 [Myxococcales bacterium]
MSRVYDMEDKLRALYVKDHRLLSLHIDLALKCDLDCCHCYLDDKRTREMSTAQVVTLFDQAKRMGVLKLALGGGELFLRRDVPELLEEARRRRFAIVLKTHGGTVSDRIADAVRDAGVVRVDVSVYALDSSIHDAITRREGSLSRTLRGIERLTERGVRVRVNCSVMHRNRNHYKDLYREMVRRGVECQLDGSIHGTHGGTMETAALNLTVAEKADLERFKHDEMKDSPSLGGADPDFHICWAGKISGHVAPDGSLTPCVAWPMPVGNVLDTPLDLLWKHAPLLQEIRGVRRKDRGCGGCSFEHQCNFCPGKAYVENRGEWLAPAPLQCADTTGKVWGILAFNASQVHPERRVEFPILKPGALHAGPARAKGQPRPKLTPEMVERVPREQTGRPRSRLFRILSDTEVQGARGDGSAGTMEHVAPVPRAAG